MNFAPHVPWYRRHEELDRANEALGFPPIPKDEIERLEKSREWLKSYRTETEKLND